MMAIRSLYTAADLSDPAHPPTHTHTPPLLQTHTYNGVRPPYTGNFSPVLDFFNPPLLPRDDRGFLNKTGVPNSTGTSLSSNSD